MYKEDTYRFTYVLLIFYQFVYLLRSISSAIVYNLPRSLTLYCSQRILQLHHSSFYALTHCRRELPEFPTRIHTTRGIFEARRQYVTMLSSFV